MMLTSHPAIPGFETPIRHETVTDRNVELCVTSEVIILKMTSSLSPIHHVISYFYATFHAYR